MMFDQEIAEHIRRREALQIIPIVAADLEFARYGAYRETRKVFEARMFREMGIPARYLDPDFVDNKSEES